MVYGSQWLQLSDFHLGADADFRMNGQHVRRRARALLPMMQRADHILLSGDLSEDGSEASYRFLLGLLEQTQARVWALAGNHDDPQQLQRVLGPRLEHGLPVVALGDWQLVLLDSSSGRVAVDQLQRVQTSLLDCPTAVFLHHHPLPCGSAWMDRYLLQQADELLHWLDSLPALRVVAFGHVHQSLLMNRRGVSYVACPAVAYAVQPFSDTFHATNAPPAARWWRFGPGGAFHTVVEWVQGC